MLLSTFSWFTPFYIPTHLILLYFRIDSHYLLFTTHSHNSVLLCRTVAKMHFITQVISVSNKKKILAFNYRRVCQNSSHHPAQHCSLPFSIIFKHYHTHFIFCSTSQPLHLLNSADCARKKQLSSQSIHCSPFCFLQAPSRVLNWFSSSADPVWYLSGLYTAYRLWIFLPFKAPRVHECCVRACQTFTADCVSTVGSKTMEVSCKNHLPPVIQLH